MAEDSREETELMDTPIIIVIVVSAAAMAASAALYLRQRARRRRPEEFDLMEGRRSEERRVGKECM